MERKKAKNPKKVAAARKAGRARMSPRGKEDREFLKARVLVLRAQRDPKLTMRQIADSLGVSAGQVCALIGEGLSEARGHGKEGARFIREEAIHRMQRVSERLYDVIDDDSLVVREEKVDDKGEVKVMQLADFEKMTKCVTALVKVDARLAALCGTEAPQKVSLDDQGGLTMAAVAKAFRERKDRRGQG